MTLPVALAGVKPASDSKSRSLNVQAAFRTSDVTIPAFVSVCESTNRVRRRFNFKLNLRVLT